MTEIKHKAFLFDATRCIDCRACMVACSVENQVPVDHTRIWVHDQGVQGEFPDLTSRIVAMSFCEPRSW